jgi:apolipoprotein N-acyltransferase
MRQLVIKTSFKQQYLLSFIAGCVLVFAYAPFSFWLISLLIPALWLILLQNKTITEATKLGFFFGLGWFGAGISWVHVSIATFGGMPLAVSLLLMLLLCGYLAIYPALACYLASRFNTKKTFNPWLLPPFWLVSEYLRSVILTGFPWLSLGYSQINSPLAVFAPVIGEVGISLIVLIITVCLSQLLLRQKSLSHAFILLILFSCTWVLSQASWLTLTGKTVKVALIQGNIKQELRWQREQEWPTMLKYLDLTRANYDADIIVWPESAIPKLEPLAQEYLTNANSAAAVNNSAIITGIQNYDLLSKQYFNGLIVLGKKDKTNTKGQYNYQSTNRYYKHHLLPIGEFVPFGDLLRPLAPFFNLPMSSFSRGDYVQANIKANGLKVLPLICFEIVFAEQLRANFHQDTDLLLTVSNDAWFGDSHGPHQHLEITRMRALEFGRPMLRATNNGVTAAIDHQGKVIKQIPQFSEAVLKTKVQLVSGQTPYSHWGNWLSYLLAVIIFAAVKLKKR